EKETAEEANEAFQKEAANSMNGIIQYTEEPLVSTDYNTKDYWAIADGLTTMVMEDNKVKVLAWYDNEWGYFARVVDLVNFVGQALQEGQAPKQAKISKYKKAVLFTIRAAR